jgi:hypothetical protein
MTAATYTRGWLGNWNRACGTAAAIVILLMWFGAEIDAGGERQKRRGPSGDGE